MKFIKRILTAVIAVTILASLVVGASAIELKTGIGVVETGGLRLRAKPDTSAEILANAGIGDNVVIIRQVGDWYLVDYNLIVGYMHKDYITFHDKKNVELGDVIVESGNVNMRATPGTDGELLATLSQGETAYAIGFNSGWYKVQYNGMTGYIRSDLVALMEAPKLNAQLTVGKSPVVNTVGQKIIALAQDYIGVPYVWGGTTPNGFDCSGFTKYVFEKMGYSLKRTAAQQLTNGYAVSDLKVGDLVFFTNTYTTSAAASHVGIYMGDNLFIHAAGGGVKITSLDHEYYAPRYIGARRIIE